MRAPTQLRKSVIFLNVVSIALTASDISILSRVNADVTEIPDVKYAN